MKVSTETAREIAADTRKVIYPEGMVRQIAADLVSERERVAELEAQLSAELNHRIQARTSKPEWQSFLTLKYGEARTILVLLQDGQISVCKACEALAELAHGVSPRIPELQGEPLSDDVVPSKRIAELEAALAQQKQMYEHEAKWRKAYQEAKGKMYAAGGEIGQFAIDNMPCNEGELDLWFRKIYVSRKAYDSLKAELEAQLAEARRDGERLDLIESRYLCVSYLSMNSKWDVLTNEAHPAHRKHYQRKSLRAAIDAAAAAEEEEKK